MKTRIQLVSVASLSIVIAIALWAETGAAASIIHISAPVGSDDATSHPRDEGVWSVTAPPYPFDVNTGIGYLINPVYPTAPTPAVASDFSRHDHIYVSAHAPDPTRAVVTYQFDAPVAVDQLEVIQHSNGMTRIEAYVGNSLGSLTSIGSIFGPSGDNTTFNGLTEGGSQVFDFDNAVAGTYFQFIVRKTNVSNGWATYRAFPRLSDGTRIAAATQVPEPTSVVIMGVAMLGVVAIRRRSTRGK